MSLSTARVRLASPAALTLLWLLSFALFANIALAAAPSGEPTHPAHDWKAIQRVIRDQLQALKAGDGKKALTYAAPGIQDQFGTPENFLRMVRNGYGALLDARYTKFLEGAIIGGNTIQPLRLVLTDDTVLVALYQMEKQKDGSWRIAGCVIAPSTVIAT
ncbi:MAG: DUF4864 domain-containing protein [Betaproteobacteria bacterium]|nr:DUF4864 domain-containing protein [Betaproteobacteria bacterium]